MQTNDTQQGEEAQETQNPDTEAQTTEEPQQESAQEEAQTEESEPAGQEEQGAQDKEETSEEAQPEKPEEKHKRVGGFQRKIDRLERQNQILLEQLQQRSGQQPQGGQPAKEKTAEQKAADYLDTLVEQRLAARDAQRQAEARQAEFQRRAAEVRVAHPDFDEVVLSTDAPVSEALSHALLTSERGPEIMYQLAKNPAELARLSALPPLDAAREVGRLEAKASGAAPQKPKSAVRPPAPPSKVGGSASSTRSMEDLPISEYKRAYRSKVR